jgi:acyl-coenzyme A thioesterase PaaI-like protein
MVEFDDEQLHLSPVHKRLGMSVVDFKPGFVVLSMPLSDEVRGVYEGTITVTTDMHVRYYRQPRGGPLRAEAEMVHHGRTLLSSECSVFDAESRVLIRSTATYTRISTQGLVVPAGEN